MKVFVFIVISDKNTVKEVTKYYTSRRCKTSCTCI